MKITVVTTMRNEGAHLLEWVAHHHAVGVSDFLVYVNDCEDGSEALLDLLPCVHVVRQEPGEKPPQWRALREAWDHPAVTQADWLACLDCDEFINLGNGLRGIPEVISRMSADAILMPWRLFGHSGHADLSDGPTTVRFTHAAAPDMLYPAIGSYFKTLFRRDGPFRQFGVHRPKQKKAERHGLPRFVDGSGHDMPESFAARESQIMHWGQPVARDLVQLNHYSLRSAADFMLKRGRGLPNHVEKKIDLTYWVERNFNTVEETTIAPMRAATAAMEAAFLDIPGVAEAQARCRAWARDRFAALMRKEEALKFYGRLLLADGSAQLPNDRAMALINAYRNLHV